MGHGCRRPRLLAVFAHPSHDHHFLNALRRGGGCRHESEGSAPQGLGSMVILATSPSYFSFASTPVRGQGWGKWVQKGLGDYWGSRASQGLGPPPKTRLGPALVQNPAMVPTCISVKVQLLGLWDPNPPTRDGTCAPSNGSADSQPLDCQGSPHSFFL